MQYFHNRFFMTVFVLSLLVNGALWLWLTDTLSPSPEPIPLHYNIYFGIDLVGPWWYRFGFPAVGFATIVVNTVLGVVFFERTKFLSGLATVVMAVLQALLFLGAYLSVTNV